MAQVEDSFGIFYRGELLNETRNGHGTFVYAEKCDIFQGDFENDVLHMEEEKTFILALMDLKACGKI